MTPPTSSGAGRPSTGDRLPCGVAFADLLNQVADSLPPADPAHQRTCPHCRAALAEIRALWAPVLELAARDVRAPAGLLETVMERIRTLPRDTWYAVLPDAQGNTRIGARVVAAIARLAAEEVPAVTLALGRGRTGAGRQPSEIAGSAAEPATDVGASGDHVVVDVQVVVTYGARIPDTADAVRAHIARRIAAHTGLTTAEVNITIVDVYRSDDF